MNDSLTGFDWHSLYRRYDGGCGSFDASSTHLTRFASNRPATDRELYYRLVECYSPDNRLTEPDPVGLYESLLYWKLYSQPAARSRISVWLAAGSDARTTLAVTIQRFLSGLPTALDRDIDAVVELVEGLRRFKLPGMVSPGAIPVRSTFLHFLYPQTVPIFDMMVLQAVGVRRHGANHDIQVFREYLPFVWQLANRHGTAAVANDSESALRLMDMALWITRGTFEDT